MLQAKENPANGKHPLWTIRSKEEATQFWEAEFGNSKDSGVGNLQAADDQAGKVAPHGEAESSGKPTVA